jgi:hypothetical protein
MRRVGFGGQRAVEPRFEVFNLLNTLAVGECTRPRFVLKDEIRKEGLRDVDGFTPRGFSQRLRIPVDPCMRCTPACELSYADRLTQPLALVCNQTHVLAPSRKSQRCADILRYRRTGWSAVRHSIKKRRHFLTASIASQRDIEQRRMALLHPVQ